MIQELTEFLNTHIPQTKCKIESVGDKTATIRHPIGPDELRPGNTVSGPILMLTADVAVYVAILNEIGIVPLAVTTNLNINFLSKPAHDRDIIAKCKLIKVGKVLVVGEVYLFSEGDETPVAHVMATYSIPPKRD